MNLEWKIYLFKKSKFILENIPLKEGDYSFWMIKFVQIVKIYKKNVLISTCKRYTTARRKCTSHKTKTKGKI